MGGIRIKFSVIFLFCVWTVTDISKAHEGEHHGSQTNHMIVTKQSVVQIPESKDTNKCIALLRRTVVRKELLTYPCFHPVPGVVPVVAHQTPMGLVCRGYTNAPTTQYIRLPTCCPGSQPDYRGRCVKDVKATTEPEKKPEPYTHQQQSAPTRRLEELPKYPASYENKRKEVFRKVMSQPRHWMPHPMIMRRIDAIMKQRKHLIEQLKKDMEESKQRQVPPRTSISDLFPSIPHPLLGKHNQQQKPSAPEIPRPSQQARAKEAPHHHHHHMSHHMPHHIPHHQMAAELHAALHKNNIPHSHDDQGNPQMHELKPSAAFLQQQEQLKQQMEARKHMSRQHQLHMLQQQKQKALAMRQQMLHHRRMQQAQLQRQQMIEQMRNAAQQSYRQMPLVPQQQRPSVQPYVVQRTFTSNNRQFPNVPNMRASVMVAVSPNSIQHFVQKTIQQSFPSIPQHPVTRYRAQLPRIPVESPPVSISPGPNSPFKLFWKCRHHHHQMLNDVAPAIHAQPSPTCFTQYMMVLKKCFNAAGVDIPIDHNMFNVNFNYNGVCEKREMIMTCIFDNLANCNTPQEQHLVKTTIGNTVDEMNRFCQIGQINGIEERLGGRGDNMVPPAMEQVQQQEVVPMEPVQEMPIIPQDHHAMSLGQHVLSHEVQQETLPKLNEVPEQQHEVQKVPEEVKPVKDEKKPAVTISEHEDSENIPGHAHAHVNGADHDHDSHISIEELREESFYLPILIGTAIGVAGIFILLLAILCICCRRRLHKKMYIEKETEKPKLFDVYTIGVPPPVYEVNGIPPISYEEAKGEKFTGSPASVRRNNAENESQQQGVSTISGSVSDI